MRASVGSARRCSVTGWRLYSCGSVCSSSRRMKPEHRAAGHEQPDLGLGGCIAGAARAVQRHRSGRDPHWRPDRASNRVAAALGGRQHRRGGDLCHQVELHADDTWGVGTRLRHRIPVDTTWSVPGHGSGAAGCVALDGGRIAQRGARAAENNHGPCLLAMKRSIWNASWTTSAARRSDHPGLGFRGRHCPHSFYNAPSLLAEVSY